MKKSDSKKGKNDIQKFVWKYEIWPIAMIVITIALSMYFSTILPETVIVHWGISGEPDGFGPKSFLTFFPPIMLTLMYIGFLFLPRLDPHKEKYNEFMHEYNIFKIAIMFFFLIVTLVSNLVNIGIPIRINFVIPISVGLLAMMIGNYMAKLKKNWFLGIRTPWTLSSDVVWQKTHRLGGWLFVIFGLVIVLATIFAIQVNWIVFLLGILVVVTVPVGYSYYLYSKIKGAE